jgi:hypothetical protein
MPSDQKVSRTNPGSAASSAFIVSGSALLAGDTMKRLAARSWPGRNPRPSVLARRSLAASRNSQKE